MPLVQIGRSLAFCFATLLCAPIANAQDGDAESKPKAASPDITWTEAPLVDRNDPTLQRGIVYGPDGQPLAGAEVYAASTIELFVIANADEVSLEDLGPVRATTDELGRFEFHTPDLTATTTSGKRIRWETLLVATKSGLAPGWVTGFGEDRGLRSHWHPHPKKKIWMRLNRPAKFGGKFLGPDGKPLPGAKVRLTSVMIPHDYDLENHIERRETKALGMFQTVSYRESFYRPWLLPGIETHATTDAEGEFSFAGLPRDSIVSFEVTHSNVQTTGMRAAVREMEPIYREPFMGKGEPTISLRGSGFTYKMPKGVTLRGQVRASYGRRNNKPIAGLTVALANHNAKSGMTGQKFKTDAEGRFEITGLYERTGGDGYTIAVVGSHDAPFASKRFTIWRNNEARLEVAPAVAYQLTLTDAEGRPVDREVESIVVQQRPGLTRNGVTSIFDRAKKVGPGVYRGIVPHGNGAVIVRRGSKRDRPVLVDPKAFFEPGRSDWTREEQRYAYGNQWHIARPSVTTTPALAVGSNSTLSQLDLAAVAFTNSAEGDTPLELSAQIVQDTPPRVSLVDEAGEPVRGARLSRQLKRYNGKDLSDTFRLYGLHPERAEHIEFRHDERGLIGYLRAKLTGEPLRVVMQPAATIKGRFVAKDGKATSDFGAIVTGATPPDTLFANRVFGGKESDRGRFEKQVPPGVEYSGHIVRKTHEWRTRPTLGVAFGPITPKPGETIDLGDIVVP